MKQALAAETGPTTRELLEEVARRSLTAGLLWPEVSQQFEKLFLQQALRMSGDSIHGAAELMGVHRNTVSRKLREYGLVDD